MSHADSLVSVIVPTRNRRQLLALALASVLEQRGVRLEVVVVDEASTDETAAMVRGIADARVRLVRHEVPLGKSAARNRGIAEAHGEWIAFLDDDDVWAPDKLALQLEALHHSGRQWAYTGAVNITAAHQIIGGAPPRPPEDVAKSLHRVNLIPGGCSGVIVNRRMLPAAGFDGEYRLCEDWDLWIRLAKISPPTWVSKPLVGYRVHAGNSSLDTVRFVVELDMLENRYGGPVDRAVFYRHLARVCLRANRQWQAARYYVRAAAHDRPAYFTGRFAADMTTVVASTLSRIRSRFGVRRTAHIRADDPHALWKAEARVWLERFVREHRSGRIDA
jgi:glycosyltransferase involved in cell wall biosynthesis